MFYGGHVTISRGIINGIKSINSIGGNMIQVFISNPITLNYKNKYSEVEFEEIRTYIKTTNSKIVIHLPYVLNLAKPNVDKQIKLICEQLTTSESLTSLGCVLHMGKYLELTETDGITNMYNALVKIIDFIEKNKLKTHIIVETPAGQGTEILVTRNNDLTNLANFYNKFTKDQKAHLRICVDTCHIFASGYDLRKKEQVDTFFKEFNKKIGIKYIDLIHLNDSKHDYNSHLDRHEDLCKGKIGCEGIVEFIKNASKYDIPLILETPSSYINEIKLIKTNI